MIFTSCQVNCWSELWAQKSCIQSRQPARSQPYPLRTDLKPTFRPQNRAFLWTRRPKPALISKFDLKS